MVSEITTRRLNAVNAYGVTQKAKQTSTNGMGGEETGKGSDGVKSLGTALNSALKGAIKTGKTAESMTATGLSGKGDLTAIATPVEEAKLTLQTVITVRDRMV
mgnify:CR=1 FL=1